MEGFAVVDGGPVCPLAETRLAVTDDGLARGDGAFETVGIWGGHPFRLDDHLARLTMSLAGIGLPAPNSGRLVEDVGRLVAAWGARDGVLRAYVTGSGTHLLTIALQPVRPPLRVLSPQPAPWIRPRSGYRPAGAKTMSYGPNVAATRAAQREGADDALLISLEGEVLEGPTFGVCWTEDGVLLAPPVELGIVDSISRRTVLDLARREGIEVRLETRGLGWLARAGEVLVVSSVRPLQALVRVAVVPLPAETPVHDRLAPLLDGTRRSG